MFQRVTGSVQTVNPRKRRSAVHVRRDVLHSVSVSQVTKRKMMMKRNKTGKGHHSVILSVSISQVTKRKMMMQRNKTGKGHHSVIPSVR